MPQVIFQFMQLWVWVLLWLQKFPPWWSRSLSLHWFTGNLLLCFKVAQSKVVVVDTQNGQQQSTTYEESMKFWYFNCKHSPENPYDLILAPVPPGSYHLYKYLFLWLQQSIQLSSDIHRKADFPCLFTSLLYFSHLNLITLIQFMKKPAWKEVLKFIIQFYWPTTSCDQKVDEWTHSRKKKKKEENSRMNKWQHTIPHSSLTWASQGRIILLRMSAACLGNGALSI